MDDITPEIPQPEISNKEVCGETAHFHAAAVGTVLGLAVYGVTGAIAPAAAIPLVTTLVAEKIGELVGWLMDNAPSVGSNQ